MPVSGLCAVRHGPAPESGGGRLHSRTLARTPAAGLLHVTNEGACSWHELAVAALRAAGLDAPVEAIAASDLKLPARRPGYSVLDASRYRTLGLTRPRPWQDALAELVQAEPG